MTIETDDEVSITIEFEPQLEEMIIRFLHDTANCYMMEVDREEGKQK